MHLWTDLDDNQQPDETMGRGRIRRLTESVVLAALREWLLADYVASYCRSLAATRIFRRCYLIDALGLDAKTTVTALSTDGDKQTRSARGRKKDAVQAIPLALQPLVSLSQALAQESKPITLYGLLLEYGSSKRKDARQDGKPTKEITIPKESGVIRTSWLEVAPKLLQEIEQSPTIFLLNPFGQTMFTHDDLALLYQRKVPTELCLLLSYKQIETLLLTALRSSAYAIALTAVLRTDRWKTLSMKEEERQHAIDDLIDLFVKSMQRYFVLPVQQITLPMQTRPAVVENIPYTLLFATRRQDSLISMNDALCLYQRRIYEQSHRGVLGEEWFAAQRQERIERERRQLQQHILQQGRSQRVRRWPDLRQQVLHANFGQFLLHDYDDMLRQLLLSGEVRCEWRRKPTEDETERLPGNDDTLLWR